VKLLIVESPAKAKTINSYLKDMNEWNVMASLGHIKNLPSNEHGIELENGKFVGKWVVEDEGKRKIIARLKEEAKKSEAVYIATDGDYEGERIASDLIEELGLNKERQPYCRIVFGEITKSHIVSRLKDISGTVNNSSVEAQMARRMLDREIGYPLSQIIKKDFERKGEETLPNGIGRVVSASLAIVVEAEKNRRSFVSKPYKKIFSDYVIDGLQVRLTNKVKYFEESNIELEDTLGVIRNSPHIVKLYDERLHDKAPPKPLTTSTLQRGAFYLHGFEEPYTMKIAQTLFEGVEVYGERLGLITYMRTDSFRLSDEAVDAAIQINNKMFGEDATLYQRRVYENRKGAHNAHEAIRPTQFSEQFLPENIADELKKLENGEDVLKVYSFIYKRFLATQLQNATFDHSYIEVEAGGNVLSVRANMLLERGWYVIGTDIINDYNDEYGAEKEVILPEAMAGDELRAIDTDSIETYTRTPERYGRGRFITTLENKGIGRPSTMATIIPNLIKKEYIVIENKMLVPTVLGEKVHEWTAEHFEIITEAESARALEEKLDEIESGEANYQELIAFYHDKVEHLKLEIGLNPNAPSPQQIEYAQSIAKANGQILDLSVLQDRKKLSYYIDNAPKGECIGKCPACKNGKVYVNDRAFECSQKHCKFKIWKNAIGTFFKNFRKEIEPKEYKRIVMEILERGDVEMGGLTTKRGETGAIVAIEKNKNGDGYWLTVKEYVENNSRLLGEMATEEQDAIALIKMVTEMTRKVEQVENENRRLKDDSIKDPLTRAYNRRKFDEDKGHYENSKEAIHVAFLDGDKFKSINDQHGHDVGDEVLRYYANTMSDVLRETNDVFYRFGGEEFVLVLKGHEMQGVEDTLESIRNNIESGTVEYLGKNIKTTVSIGFSNLSPWEKIEDAVKRADEAVYDAKENGRNRIEAKIVSANVLGEARPDVFVW